jgi:hypothetical protein
MDIYTGHLYLLTIENILQWTWKCKYLFKILFSIILDIYPEMGLLDHKIVMFLIYKANFLLFFLMATLLYIPTSGVYSWY